MNYTPPPIVKTLLIDRQGERKSVEARRYALLQFDAAGPTYSSIESSTAPRIAWSDHRELLVVEMNRLFEADRTKPYAVVDFAYAGGALVDFVYQDPKAAKEAEAREVRSLQLEAQMKAMHKLAAASKLTLAQLKAFGPSKIVKLFDVHLNIVATVDKAIDLLDSEQFGEAIKTERDSVTITVAMPRADSESPNRCSQAAAPVELLSNSPASVCSKFSSCTASCKTTECESYKALREAAELLSKTLAAPADKLNQAAGKLVESIETIDCRFTPAMRTFLADMAEAVAQNSFGGMSGHYLSRAAKKYIGQAQQ